MAMSCSNTGPCAHHSLSRCPSIRALSARWREYIKPPVPRWGKLITSVFFVSTINYISVLDVYISLLGASVAFPPGRSGWLLTYAALHPADHKKLGSDRLYH